MTEGIGFGAAGQIGTAMNQIVFELTDAEGNALTGATIAAAQLNNNAFGGDAAATRMINGFNGLQVRNTAQFNPLRLNYDPAATGDQRQVRGNPVVAFPTASSMMVTGMSRSNDVATEIQLDVAFRINTAPNFSGPVYVTATTSIGGFSETVQVAYVNPIIEVETTTTFVQIGSVRTPVANVIIRELEPGAIRPGTLTIGLTQNEVMGLAGFDQGQVLFHPIANANISITTEGPAGSALTMNVVGNTRTNIYAATGGAVVGEGPATGNTAVIGAERHFTVNRQSTSHPSTITITGLAVQAGSMAVSGFRNIQVGGFAITDTNINWVATSHDIRFATPNVLTAANFINVGTEAAGNIFNEISIRANEPIATVNGAPRPLTNVHGEPTPILNIDDRMMVPIRALSNAFGFEVVPSDLRSVGGAFEVWVTAGNTTAVFTLGSTTVRINNVDQTLPGFDVAPTIPTSGPGANSFYLPFRALGEAFDIPVYWVPATSTAWFNPPANVMAPVATTNGNGNGNGND